MSDFQAAYERILEATGLHTQTEVASLLCIRQSSISDAKRRSVIPDKWLITLFETHALNPVWVRSGDGPRYLTGSDGQAPLPLTVEQCAARLVPVLQTALEATVPDLAARLREALDLPAPAEPRGSGEEGHDAP